mmetsp:Transcript_14778/g.24637  ORF Transcript_14778/g.24637 Transcript_14778/m.24637 type:complete len:80 (+) Transcript_14778:2037-2276(+)
MQNAHPLLLQALTTLDSEVEHQTAFLWNVGLSHCGLAPKQRIALQKVKMKVHEEGEVRSVRFLHVAGIIFAVWYEFLEQ